MKGKLFLIVSLFMVLILLLSFVGCKKATPTPTPTPAPTVTAVPTATKTATPTAAPKYPEKNIEISIAFAPGTGTDSTVRAMGRVLKSENLLPASVETLFLNENIGSTGAIGISVYAAKETNNPYRLMFNPRVILLNQIRGVTPYGWKDLKPIALLVTTYNGIAVRADSPYKSLKDVLAALQKDPKSATIMGQPIPATDWNGMCTLFLAANIPIDKIYYATSDNPGEIMAALLGGKVDITTSAPEDVMGQIEAGKVRLLGVSSLQRLPKLPDVPTYSEVVGKECTFYNWRALFGPKQMPADAVNWWADTLTKMDKTEAWKAEAAKLNAFPNLITTDAFTKYLEKDNADATTLLKTVGLIK